MPTDPLRFLERGDVDQTEDAEKVVELFDVFRDCRIVREDCTLQALLDCNATVDDLSKAIASIRPFLEQKTFEDLWAKAHNAAVVPSAQSMKVKDVFRFKRWITSPSGQIVLSSLQTKKKLEKSGKERFGPDEMGLKRLFTAQHEDLTAQLSQWQVEADEKIAELKSQIEVVRKALAELRDEAKKKHSVAAGFVELSADEVKGRSWTMYVEECAKKNEAPVIKTGTNLDLVGEKYGSLVRDQHLIDYLKRDGVREALHRYGEEKVKALKEAGKHRQVNTFRNIMAITGAPAADEVPVESEKEDAGADSGGENPILEEPAGDEEAEGDTEEQATPKKDRVRTKDKASSSKKARKRGLSKGPIVTKWASGSKRRRSSRQK